MKNIVSIISILSGFFLMLWSVSYVNEFFVNEGYSYFMGKFLALITSFGVGVMGGSIIYFIGYIIPKELKEKFKNRK